MLTKDIHIGREYAIRGVNGLGGESSSLHRFRVTAVISKRTGSSPSDIKVVAEGVVTGLNGTTAELRLKPKVMLGPYEDYVELVKQREAEAAKRKQERQEAEDRQELARKLLQEKVGLVMDRHYKTTSINIAEPDMPKFVEWLERATQEVSS